MDRETPPTPERERASTRDPETVPTRSPKLAPSLDRRTLLHGTAVAGGLLLAGCTSSKADEGTSLSVANVDFYENDEGFLEVAVVVSNPGNERDSGTLLVHVKIDGDAQPRVREVSLDAHETKEFTITYDTKFADVQNMDVNATIEDA